MFLMPDHQLSTCQPEAVASALTFLCLAMLLQNFIFFSGGRGHHLLPVTLGTLPVCLYGEDRDIAFLSLPRPWLCT